MMNLTQHLKVVGSEQAGMHPQPGWYIVVLKQVGEGRVFHCLLQPGQRPPEPGLLERMLKSSSDLVSIPVSANANLRHEFTSTIEHVSPGHSFEADYTLAFAVAAPDIVATRWIEDPVRKVEEEIRRVLDPAARSINWTTLREQILRDGALQLCQPVVQTCLGNLRDFATNHGIQIGSLRLELRLSLADAQPDVALADLERQKVGILIDKERRLSEMNSNHDLAKLGAAQQAELRSMQRPQQIFDAGTEGIVEAIKNVAGNMTRGEDFTRTLREVAALMSQPVGGGTAASRALAGDGRLALSAPTESGEKLISTIGAALELAETLPVDRTQKRELLAVVLHLIAEAWRGATADPEVADRYETRAADLINKVSGLAPEQFTALRRFANFELVQERLR